MKQANLKVIIAFFPLMLSLGSLGVTAVGAQSLPHQSTTSSNSTASGSSSGFKQMNGQEIAPRSVVTKEAQLRQTTKTVKMT